MVENVFLDKHNIKRAENYNKNFEYFLDNFDIIKKNSRGRFIAIYNADSFISENNYESLLAKLQEKGITDIGSAFIKYISLSDEPLIV